MVKSCWYFSQDLISSIASFDLPSSNLIFPLSLLLTLQRALLCYLMMLFIVHFLLFSASCPHVIHFLFFLFSCIIDNVWIEHLQIFSFKKIFSWHYSFCIEEPPTFVFSLPSLVTKSNGKSWCWNFSKLSLLLFCKDNIIILFVNTCCLCF